MSKPKSKQFGVWQGYGNDDEQYFNWYDTLNEAVTSESSDAVDGEVEVWEMTPKLLGTYEVRSVVVKKRNSKKK